MFRRCLRYVPCCKKIKKHNHVPSHLHPPPERDRYIIWEINSQQNKWLFFICHPSFKVRKQQPEIVYVWVYYLYHKLYQIISFIVPVCDYDRTKCNVQYVHVFSKFAISDTGRRKYLKNSSRNSVDTRWFFHLVH